MSDFDPYHIWLGIPETERPISKYRLLGIADFEDNREVISAGAEQRTIYLRTLQAGEHEALVAQLLNEVSQARVTLLNEDQKAEYDEGLREQQTPEPEPAAIQTPETPPVPVIRPESESTPAPIPVVQTSPPLQSTPPQYFVSAKHLDEDAENELELVPLEVNATSPSIASVAQKGNKRTGNLQNDLWKSTAIISISLVGVIGVLVLVISIMSSGDVDRVASNAPPVVTSPPIPPPLSTGGGFGGSGAGNNTDVQPPPERPNLSEQSQPEPTANSSIKNGDSIDAGLNYLLLDIHHASSVANCGTEIDNFRLYDESSGELILSDFSETTCEFKNWETFSMFNGSGALEKSPPPAFLDSGYVRLNKGRGPETVFMLLNRKLPRDFTLTFDLRNYGGGHSHVKLLSSRYPNECFNILTPPSDKEKSYLGFYTKIEGPRPVWAFTSLPETVDISITEFPKQPPGEWLHYRIEKNGTTLVMSINDKKVALTDKLQSTVSSSPTLPIPTPKPESKPTQAAAKPIPANLQEGLVAYYPFNGNAKDESGNGNHGEINGSTASVDRHGRQESAYHFDKAGDCISQTSDSETPTGLSDCTICLWVYPEKLIKHGHVLLANGVTDDYQLALDYSDTPTSRPIELIVGSIRYKSQTMAWELNTWYHLIVVRNQGRLLFFRDGEDIGGAEGTARNRATDGNRALIFAARGTAGHQWHGKLDDIRIYNRALSSAEVKSLYEYETTSPNQPNPTPPLPPEPAQGTAESIPANLLKGLFAYYPFNGNAKDESGQGHHASHSSSIPVKDRFGKENSAQRFRGQDHIEVPHSDEFNLQQQQGFTISLWINAFKGNGGNALVSKNNGGGDQDKWFLTLNDSKVLFHVNYGEGRSTHGTGDEGSYLINKTPSFNLDEWGHILISSDRQKLRFFSNGKLIWQQPVFGGPPSNNKASIKIGMTEGANYYSGLMDDIRFYNRALSSAEVKALYEYESKPPAPPITTAPVLESITNTIGMTLNKIPAGTFMMGSPESEPGRRNDEHQHKVTITKAFYMQTTEVTQGQWKEVMGTEPWKGKQYVKEGLDYAATWVSWDNAVAYCEKLSIQEGKTYRLPTEAEWEYACRAGTETRWSFSNDEKDLGDYAWHKENARDIGEEYAHQVGLKKPNAFGLYDMHGNVWEWCHDYFEANYYERSPGQDPRGPQGSASDSSRVLRGGSWFYDTRYARFASRNRSDKVRYLSVDFGFRLVRELD
jgi:sulfatase modifying factor 1